MVEFALIAPVLLMIQKSHRGRAGKYAAAGPNRTRHRGQSLVEFTLIVPIVFLLFIGVADLGRVFIAGVVLETAARDAAEKGAQEYVANPPGGVPLSTSAPSGNGAYYGSLDAKVATAACSESAELPNTDLVTSDQTCKTWPVIRVCVHDGADPQCGQPITGFASAIPAQCSDMNAAWSNSQDGSPTDSLGRHERWVEVRLCYKFTSIIHTDLFHLGDIYLERRRQFVIPCYFQLGADPCG
jgi:hypothetical protein